MYQLPHFEEKDQEKVLAFVKANPFAFICGCTAAMQPVATQIPVFIEEREGKLFLKGHMMRNTDHHLAFVENAKALVVFTGAHTYVSASWYSDPHTASTWNYMSVHATGRLRFLDEAALIEVLRETTNHFENDPGSLARFESLPAEYVAKLSKAIVAFEIAVEDIGNVFKLSQNRDAASFDNIIDKLKARDAGAAMIADEMASRKDELFS